MLTRLQVENAKPQDKPVRLFDGRGLYLEVATNGSRYWRFKYRFAGKEKRLSLGVYPEVGIKEARDRREDARKLVQSRIDPAEQRKAEKLAVIEKTENTFEAIAREWFAMFSPRWVEAHSSKIIRRLEVYIFPWLGTRPLKDIKALELLNTLRRIETKGAKETAHRALQICGRIMRYAVATGRAERDVSRDLMGGAGTGQGAASCGDH